MSKNKIRIIISLMGLSSLALIAFQVYWIGYTARSNNEVFAANAREAMSQVVRKLEKQELVYLTQKKEEEDKKNRELLAIAKENSLKRNLKKANRQSIEPAEASGRTYPNNKMVSQADVIGFNPFQIIGHNLPVNDINISFNVENPTYDDLLAIERFNDLMISQLSSFESMGDSAIRFDFPNQKKPKKKKLKPKTATITLTANDEKKEKIAQKSALMKDVFGEMLLKDRPISQRINQLALDSLLKFELKQKGIDIPIEYGIALQHDKKQLHYLSNKNLNSERQNIIKTQGFKASLFPNDLFSSTNQLFVYFPTRQDYIRESIWLNILGSIAMISIVLGCFYVAVNTIIRQKKLADIKNDFINNMTHEFKTPISTISLACEVLNDKEIGRNEKIMGRYLGIIKEENNRLGLQVEKVLQTALLDKGEVKMKMSDVNINTTIEQVVENISPQLETKNGSIELNLTAKNQLLMADQVHITNLIFNLLDNAIKYSSQTPHIKIITYDSTQGIGLQIIDNGIGMTEESQKNIFEKFYRVPTGNLHDVKGFGLGLSYVKKIVDEHHGRINVQSQLGQGTTFDIFLPLAQNQPINNKTHQS